MSSDQTPPPRPRAAFPCASRVPLAPQPAPISNTSPAGNSGADAQRRSSICSRRWSHANNSFAGHTSQPVTRNQYGATVASTLSPYGSGGSGPSTDSACKFSTVYPCDASTNGTPPLQDSVTPLAPEPLIPSLLLRVYLAQKLGRVCAM